MTSKERVQAAISFQKPDRTPFNFWMDRRLMADYEQRFGPAYRVHHYGADVVETFMDLRFPSAVESVYESGTHWVTKPALDSVANAVDLPMPNPDDDFVLDLVKNDRREFPDKFLILDTAGALTIMGGLRRYENVFTDFYDYPEEMTALLDRISDVTARAVERACDCGIDAVYVMDDIGSKNGLLMSPAMLEDWVLRFNRKSIDAAKAACLPVFSHSDGAVMDILDRLVEHGVQVVNPLEPHLNDLEAFRDRYQQPHKLAAYGALDTYGIIRTGTPQDVRTHVSSTFELLGTSGGLIFSTHDIPIDTPQENVDAMVDEIKQCRPS